MRRLVILTCATTLSLVVLGHDRAAIHAIAQANPNVVVNPNTYQDLRWRSVGPHRGGRSTAAAGVRTQPGVFYMGATGGGVWKSENYGLAWMPIADGQIPTGSVGSIEGPVSHPNVAFAGT